MLLGHEKNRSHCLNSVSENTTSSSSVESGQDSRLSSFYENISHQPARSLQLAGKSCIAKNSQICKLLHHFLFTSSAHEAHDRRTPFLEAPILLVPSDFHTSAPALPHQHVDPQRVGWCKQRSSATLLGSRWPGTTRMEKKLTPRNICNILMCKFVLAS